MSESKVIAARVIDPSEPRLFSKRKKSDPAEFLTITCSCDSCPLLKAGQCITMRVLSGSCVYGALRREHGPTGRSAKIYDWMKERRNRHPGIGWNLGYPAEKLAFIGEYVYLPYAHMDMRKDVPFVRHSAYIVSGVEFIKRDDWTLENVLRLIDFRPQSLFGGEITDYQKKHVPLFITHIRECDPDMWAKLITARPQYDVAPNYVGRKAILATLAHPITLPPYEKKYPVEWHWNGKTLTTTSPHAYGDTWGNVKADSAAIEITPAKDAAVVVQSNEWVTPETIFVD